MDRQIVYPAQIPLDSDLLNAQRNAFVGLGHLAGMAYGDNTVAAGGFACTPGTGLAVTIAPGSLLAAGVVDGTAYGTLAANGSVLVRQHISRDPVTLTVPGAGATYTVYATPATVDADATVLPFYNAADPAVTYAGADNSGKAAPTVRQDVAQLGIAATVPDGAYPLWTITVPAAATAMTADMIAQAEGAPFYETIPELQASKISKSGDGMTGPLTVLNAEAAQNPVALGQLPGLTTGRLIGIQTFTASGTYTPTAGATSFIADVQGGGGAGGSVQAQTASSIGVSGPGAGGAFVRIRGSLTGIESLAVTVGQGGAPVANQVGGSGAASSVGSLATAPGGYGGHAGPPGEAYWIDDAGSTGASPSVDTSVTALLSIPVQAPTGGITLSATSTTGGRCGKSGGSFYGAGAPEVRAEEATASDGPVPGAGGSGNCVSATGPAIKGGAGADGIVTFWEFA